MIKHFFLICSLACGLLLQACYYDNETILYNGAAGGTACDTTNVTYSGTIAPIMQSKCNNCHGATSGNRVITSDYTHLKIIATQGTLVNSVNWTGSIPMPQGEPKMPACTLAKINKWVKNGALNN